MGEMLDTSLRRHDPDRMFREAELPSPFPRGISHADVDSLTEINGHLLVQEFKHEGEGLKLGQFYTLRAIRQMGHHSLVVWFDNDGPVEWHIFGPGTKGVRSGDYMDVRAEPVSLERYHDFEKRWAEWADRIAREETA